MTLEEAYEILKISSEATDEEVKKAYYKLSKIVHPDTNPNNPFAEDNTKEVNEAYNLIKRCRQENASGSSRTNAQDTQNNYNAYQNNTYTSYEHQEYAHKSEYAYENPSDDDDRFELSTFDPATFNKKEYLKKLRHLKKVEQKIVKCIKKRRKYNSAEALKIIRTCSLGILLRQSLEYIIQDILVDKGIPNIGNLKDKIETLKSNIGILGNMVSFKDIYIFDKLRILTNKCVHRHFSEEKDLYSKYIELYKPFIIFFDGYFAQKFKDHKFNELTYLNILKNELYAFIAIEDKNIYRFLYDKEHRLTKTLLAGTLLRHVLECIVDEDIIKNVPVVLLSNEMNRELHDKISNSLSNKTNKKTRIAFHKIRIYTNATVHVQYNDYRINNVNYTSTLNSYAAEAYKLIENFDPVRKHLGNIGVAIIISLVVVMKLAALIVGLIQEAYEDNNKNEYILNAIQLNVSSTEITKGTYIKLSYSPIPSTSLFAIYKGEEGDFDKKSIKYYCIYDGKTTCLSSGKEVFTFKPEKTGTYTFYAVYCDHDWLSDEYCVSEDIYSQNIQVNVFE